MKNDIQIIDGKKMSIVPMLPRKNTLNGTGTIWENILYKAEYNKLKGNDLLLYSTGSFRLPSGEVVTDVYCPALKVEVHNVFWDELKLGKVE